MPTDTPPTALAPGVTLLPCPFCGGPAMECHVAEPSVHCERCPVGMVGETEAEAIAAWNTRAHPPAAEREAPCLSCTDPNATCLQDCTKSCRQPEREAPSDKHDAASCKPIGATADMSYRLVPVEPTPAMVQAGWIDEENVEPYDIWCAMLAAAPLLLAAAPSPPAPSQSAARERERALQEAAEIAARMEVAWAQSGQQFNEAGMIPAGDARRSYAYAAREVQREILALLAAPAEGGRDG